MRIGLDARFLTHPQRGGFKTYTTNLVRALGEVDRENEYVVYVDREPGPTDTLPSHPNFTYRTVPGTMPGLGMPLREQVLLRWRADADDLDLVHFLCNTATIGLRTRSLVTLHDTIQVAYGHSLGSARRPRDAWRWAQAAYSGFAIRRAVRSADRVIAVSHYEKLQISTTLGIPAERISVTHEAPEAEFVAPRPHMEQDREALRSVHGVRSPYILGVGHEPRKNIDLLIRAFADLCTEFPDLQLVIVAAEEARRREFQEQVRSRNLGERTVILGGVSPPILGRLYQLAEVFAFPSSREGFGLPPLEAMSCGVPTVAMRGSSIPEVVGDGAVLVDGTDQIAWTEALRTVLGSPSLRAELSARGLRRAATFSWQRCALETLAVYGHVHSTKGTL